MLIFVKYFKRIYKKQRKEVYTARVKELDVILEEDENSKEEEIKDMVTEEKYKESYVDTEEPLAKPYIAKTQN